MVLVEGHEVPVLEVDPLVAGLDAAGLAVHAQEVLEAAEAHDGARRVALLVGPPVAGDELPALEVDMALQVLLPGGLDGGLEGEDEHAPHAHALGELVGGERLAEAHLGVPQELGLVVAAGLEAALEVGLRLLHGGTLLGAHLEVLGTLALVVGPIADLEPRVAHVVGCAAVPLAADVLESVALQAPVDVVVHERGAVGSHGALGEDDLVGLALAGLDHRELLRHAPFDIAPRVADLEQPRVVGIHVAVGVDGRVDVWALGEVGMTVHQSASAKPIRESIYSHSSSSIPHSTVKRSSV